MAELQTHHSDVNTLVQTSRLCTITNTFKQRETNLNQKKAKQEQKCLTDSSGIVAPPEFVHVDLYFDSTYKTSDKWGPRGESREEKCLLRWQMRTNSYFVLTRQTHTQVICNIRITNVTCQSWQRIKSCRWHYGLRPEEVLASQVPIFRNDTFSKLLTQLAELQKCISLPHEMYLANQMYLANCLLDTIRNWSRSEKTLQSSQ